MRITVITAVLLVWLSGTALAQTARASGTTASNDWSTWPTCVSVAKYQPPPVPSCSVTNPDCWSGRSSTRQRWVTSGAGSRPGSAMPR